MMGEVYSEKTLIQKWKEHYETKDQIFKPPLEKANNCGIAFFWIFTLFVCYQCACILIPAVFYYESSKQTWHTLFICFLFAQIVWNWILTARSENCIVPGNLLADKAELDLPQGWRICPTCQIKAPPRSHHCKACKVCIMKRDHHCFFTGSCVGYGNQRRFIVWTFYVLIGVLYYTALVFRYLHDTFPIIPMSRHIFSYIPVCFIWQWLTGTMPSKVFINMLGLYAASLCGVAAVMFFIWELLLIYRGQTSYEAAHNTHLYRIEAKHNFRSVFGPYWILNFLLPLPVKQEGDGIQWEMQKRVKGN